MRNDLETVFSEGHPHHYRIFYDAKEGKYYDAHCDLYITLSEAKAFGLPC